MKQPSKMKQLINFLVSALIGILVIPITVVAQEEKLPMLIDISYYLKDNTVPYLKIFTKTKEGKKFLPAANIPVSVFINEEDDNNLLEKITTNESGIAYVTIPPSAQTTWASSPQAVFLASSQGNTKFQEASGEISITKAIIVVDTLEGAETKTLVAKVLEQQGEEWVPVKDVELKIYIKRMSGNLSAGEEETYTTDEEGNAIAEFSKDGLPGDSKGSLMFIAKTEDDDTYGNLLVELSVPWGEPFTATTSFLNQRTLWATGNKAPGWLLILAGLVFTIVWGTIIYLFFQVAIIRKEGLKIAAR